MGAGHSMLDLQHPSLSHSGLAMNRQCPRSLWVSFLHHYSAPRVYLRQLAVSMDYCHSRFLFLARPAPDSATATDFQLANS